MPRPVYKILTVVGFILFSSAIYLLQTDGQQAHLILAENYSLTTTQHGLQAHIDPVTKQFTRPTPQQRQSAQAKQTLSQSNQLRQIQLPDGTVILDLQERYRLDRRESDRSGIQTP